MNFSATVFIEADPLRKAEGETVSRWLNEKFGVLHVAARRQNFYQCFNPYKERRAVNELDDVVFSNLCRISLGEAAVIFDHIFTGCLDAPEMIPMGSTQCINTIGGFQREEYNALPRGTENYTAYTQACAKTAEILWEILVEAE